MTVAGLIFSNIHDQCMPELTRFRTMGSIPFGCRYRLIDIPLSNMVNSDITNIGIITHHNYQSLMDHLGTGKDWDLARRSGGIKLLPPYVTAYGDSFSSKLYESRLEALMSATVFLTRCAADYIVMSDCDMLANIDFKKVIAFHKDNGALMTIVTKKVDAKNYHFDADVRIVHADDNGLVTGITVGKPDDGEVLLNTNMVVFSTRGLLALINNAKGHGYRHFYSEMIKAVLGKEKIMSYPFDGTLLQISSLESYYKNSLSLLNTAERNDLFGEDSGRMVYTKIRNSAPTRYCGQAYVKNSLVADGCIIEGVVENSIIFRGVHVCPGAVVQNSILLQDTYVGKDAFLGSVITDKNVMIKDGRQLSGYETLPFYVGKGIMV